MDTDFMIGVLEAIQNDVMKKDYEAIYGRCFVLIEELKKEKQK